jgi:hypothetical protein
MDGIPATPGTRDAHLRQPTPRGRVLGIAAVAVVALVAAAGAGVWWWQHRGPAHPAIAARPAPVVRPVPVAAAGPCAGALAPVRALIAAVPSGSLLSSGGNRRLTDGLARVDASCDPVTAAAFRRVEVVPWLTYLPPAAARS